MDKIFIPLRDERELQGINKLKKLVSKYEKKCVLSTIQFKHRINEVSKEINGFNGGVILGCSRRIPQSDCYIVITTGLFHAINIKLLTNKPVFTISPEGVKELSNDYYKKELIKKEIIKAKILNSRIIGVIESTKPGQRRDGLSIVKKLREKGYEAYLFVSNEVTPSQLNDYPIDAWINTACPRIVEDEFDKPIINWDDIKYTFETHPYQHH